MTGGNHITPRAVVAMRIIAGAILIGFAIEIWLGTRKGSDEADAYRSFAYMLFLSFILMALTIALAILGVLTRNWVVAGLTLGALTGIAWALTGGTGIFSAGFRLGIAGLICALPATLLPHGRRRPLPAPQD